MELDHAYFSKPQMFDLESTEQGIVYLGALRHVRGLKAWLKSNPQQTSRSWSLLKQRVVQPTTLQTQEDSALRVAVEGTASAALKEGRAYLYLGAPQ